VPDLDGQQVLITRTADQAAPLVDAVQAAHGRARIFPALDIRGLQSDAICATIDALPPADIHLFVSPNAVRFGLEHCRSGLIGAIGPGTANAIRAAGARVDIVPSGGFASEHLLDAKELKSIEGKSIRIVRGQSGRELLGSTLAHRGARVDYVQVYERSIPEHTAEDIAALIAAWRSDGFAAWLAMSKETLDNFLTLIGHEGEQLAQTTPLISPASRVIMEAEERLPGIFAVETDGVTPDAIVDAIDGVIVRRTNQGPET
jgi:uroporphyrinogen-III synthase